MSIYEDMDGVRTVVSTDSLITNVVFDYVADLGYNVGTQVLNLTRAEFGVPYDEVGTVEWIILMRPHSTNPWCEITIDEMDVRPSVRVDAHVDDRLLHHSDKLYLDDPEFFAKLTMWLDHYYFRCGYGD